MKSEKGITLMSLIAYIMIMLIAIGILSTVTTTFYKNVKDIDTQSVFEAEANKIKLYLLEDIKERKMNLAEISNDKKNIYLTSNEQETVKYSSKKTGIYRNEILISENLHIEFRKNENTLRLRIFDELEDYSKTIEIHIP